MELKLRVISGKQAGKELAIAGPKFMIGRAADNHLRPSSSSISRHHCELLIEGEQASVKDLGSKNGTLVNDEPVAGERILQTGDRLTIGQLQFEVHLTQQLGGPKRRNGAGAKDIAGRLRATLNREELDVTALLNETPWPQAAHDTAQLTGSDTGEFTPAAKPDMDVSTVTDALGAAGSAGQQGTVGQAAGEDGSAKAPSKGTKFAGKLTPPPPPASTRDAASEFLRKMAKYR